MMSTDSQPVLSKGSLILVTGANGFIGSHVVDQFLAQGYKVRGTVRNVAANEWLQKYFDQKYGTGKLTLVQLEDLGKEGCFDEAVKGVDSFVHVASDVSLSPDPNKVIPAVVEMTERALQAAASEPSLKTFVLTSSSTAAIMPILNKEFHISRDSWNDDTVKMAWAPPPYEPSRAMVVYGASKTSGEQAAWKFIQDKHPHFSFNAILPNINLGPILVPEKQHGSTAGWLKLIYNDPETWKTRFSALPPQYYIHVQDTARLHVAAAINPSIKNERIFAFGDKFSWNRVLDICRKLRPGETVPANADNDDRDLSTVDTELPVRLLKELYDQDGFLPLEVGVRDTLSSL